jgi:hypothetical protein
MTWETDASLLHSLQQEKKKDNAYSNKDQVRSLPNFDLLQENGLFVSRELAITASAGELESLFPRHVPRADL